MRTYRYTIGVDADTEAQATAEAMHDLSLGEHLLYEYHDYDGEMPIIGEVQSVNVESSEAGPAYAVQLTVRGHRQLPHHVVPGFEIVERVDGS